MRNLLIVVLIGVLIWLLVERGNLAIAVEAQQAILAEKEIKVGELERQARATGRPIPAAGSPGARPKAGESGGSSWLDKHIEKGARALDPKKGRD